MSDFFASDEFEDGYDTNEGKPGIGLVASAIQFWSGQNYDSERKRCPSIRETAQVFRMTDADVRAAIAWHPWMFLSGPDDDPTKQFIEHEGE